LRYFSFGSEINTWNYEEKEKEEEEEEKKN
jgi:hypothetical protein